MGLEPTSSRVGNRSNAYSTALLFIFLKIAVYMRIELISLGRQPGRITITPIDRFNFQPARLDVNLTGFQVTIFNFQKRKGYYRIAYIYGVLSFRRYPPITGADSRSRTYITGVEGEVWLYYGTLLIFIFF